MRFKRYGQSMLFGVVVCLCLSSAFAQEAGTPINDSEQFLFALIRAARDDQTNGAQLLNSHRELITPQLWQRLTEVAEYNPAPPLTTYHLTLQVAEHLHDQRLIALTYYKLGRYQFGQGNISEATKSYLQSKAVLEQAGLRRDLVHVLADLGTLYIYASDYAKAREYSEQTLRLIEQIRNSSEPSGLWPEERSAGTALRNLGNIDKREGDYGRALDRLQESLAQFQKIEGGGSGKFQEDLIDSLADIGRTYLAMGDYVHALANLDKAMSAAAVSHNANRQASICNSLGILYTSQRDYPKAIQFFQQGLQLARDIGDRFTQAEILLNVGVAYQFQRLWEPALSNFQKSLEIAKAIGDKEIVILVGEGQGTVNKEQGKYGAALEALDRSLSLAMEIVDKERIAELLWRRAEVQHAEGNYAKAISSASQAADIAEQLSLKNVRYLALTALGRAYRATNQNQLASDSFSRAITGIEEMRGHVVGLEQADEVFFEDKVAPYHEMIELLLKGPNSTMQFEAFRYAELAKSRVLLDVLNGGRTDLANLMTTEERKEDQILSQAITALNIRLGEENRKQVPDDGLLVRLSEDLRLARLKYETLQNSLSAAHPRVLVENGQRTILQSTDLSELFADQKTAFLEYVITGQRVYLFCLTKGRSSTTPELRVYPIGVGALDLATRAGEFRDLLAGRDPAFGPSSRELYDLLIKPAQSQLQGKETLCIVPDGVLWEVPFQATTSSDNRYLLQDYVIYYAPSLSVLKDMIQPQKRLAGLTSVLAFGNPRVTAETTANLAAVYRGESLGPLPEAEAEVKALRDIWGADQTEVFTGVSASEQAFKSEARNFSVIHFATHGILDNANPLYSRLVMARTNDPEDDGLLEAREIMQLHLNADLVVLSACETARGRIGAGEGVIGISWAFFVAGAPTTVVSQWKVDSASTATLMIDFHQRLKDQKGATKAQALRQAALDLLKDKA